MPRTARTHLKAPSFMSILKILDDAGLQAVQITPSESVRWKPKTGRSEVYQQFVMVDALVQFATEKMDVEQTVKWAEDKIKAIYAKFT